MNSLCYSSSQFGAFYCATGYPMQAATVVTGLPPTPGFERKMPSLVEQKFRTPVRFRTLGVAPVTKSTFIGAPPFIPVASKMKPFLPFEPTIAVDKEVSIKQAVTGDATQGDAPPKSCICAAYPTDGYAEK